VENCKQLVRMCGAKETKMATGKEYDECINVSITEMDLFVFSAARHSWSMSASFQPDSSGPYTAL
jgi:hypothetical protein